MLAVFALLAGMALLSLVHEVGHAAAARLVGLHITDICLGLGPPLFSFERRGIRFLLAPIPLGGFVRVAEFSPDYRRPNLSCSSSILRMVVIVAGPATNYLFAALTAFVLISVLGIETGGSKGLKVVSADAGAAHAGLVAGDLIFQVNGRPVKDLRSLSQALAASDADADAVVAVSRGRQPKELRMSRLHARSGAWALGAAYTVEPEIRRTGLGEALGYALARPLQESASMSARAAAAIKASPANVRPLGIVGLADRVHAAKGWTWRRALTLAISLSVAMGLFNLLPFPGLDGGRLCIEAAQAICRRQLSPRWLIAIQVTGGLILLAAWVSLTAFEIHRL